MIPNFAAIDDEEDYFVAIDERRQSLLDTGMFSSYTPMTLSLRGTNFYHGIRTGEWWKAGISSSAGRYYSTEEVLEMIENPEIKTQLLFHLDLL